MTRTLVLLRHAKSDWTHDVADGDRPLAKRGLRQAPEAGRWLDAHLNPIDLAVVSPDRRTRSTWELVASELRTAPEVRVDDRLYAASARELLGVVRELSDGLATVVLVGHNPGLEDLVAELVGTWTPMPTSAIAVLELRGSWTAAGHGTARLRTSGRPPAG